MSILIGWILVKYCDSWSFKCYSLAWMFDFELLFKLGFMFEIQIFKSNDHVSSLKLQPCCACVITKILFYVDMALLGRWRCLLFCFFCHDWRVYKLIVVGYDGFWKLLMLCYSDLIDIKRDCYSCVLRFWHNWI